MKIKSILLLTIIVAQCALVACGGSSKEAKPSNTIAVKKEETKKPDYIENPQEFAEEYDNELITNCSLLLDRFVKDKKISLAPQNWKIVPFDDKGAYILSTNIEISGSDYEGIFVLTPVMDGEKMTGAKPHYISVGGEVLGDDGYCDEIFDKIKSIGQ